jgi:hypothetical protein
MILIAETSIVKARMVSQGLEERNIAMSIAGSYPRGRHASLTQGAFI